MKEAARLRLLALVDPAIATLGYAMSRRSKHLPQAVTAANSVPDRTGHVTKETVELQDVDGRVAELQAGWERARKMRGEFRIDAVSERSVEKWPESG